MDLNFNLHLFNDSFEFPMSKTNLEIISGWSDAEKWVGALLRVSRDEPCMKRCSLFVLKLWRLIIWVLSVMYIYILVY